MKLVTLAPVSEIEERLAQGWYAATTPWHRVSRWYGKIYFWMEVTRVTCFSLNLDAPACAAIRQPAVFNILFKYRFRKPGDHRREGRKSWERFEDTALVYGFLARHGLKHLSANLLYPLRDGWETANAGDGE